jgi:hypothetical protein
MIDVRFTAENRHSQASDRRPLRANNRNGRLE